MQQIPWGSCDSADADTVGSVWGLGASVSNGFPAGRWRGQDLSSNTQTQHPLLSPSYGAASVRLDMLILEMDFSHFSWLFGGL